MGVGGRWGGRLFEAGRLLSFSAFRMGAYSRWAALIRGWALIRIKYGNTRPSFLLKFSSSKFSTLANSLFRSLRVLRAGVQPSITIETWVTKKTDS